MAIIGNEQNAETDSLNCPLHYWPGLNWVRQLEFSGGKTTGLGDKSLCIESQLSPYVLAE